MHGGMDHNPVCSERNNNTWQLYPLGAMYWAYTSALHVLLPKSRPTEWARIGSRFIVLVWYLKSYSAVREFPVDGVVFVYGIYRDVTVAVTKIEKKSNHESIRLLNYKPETPRQKIEHKKKKKKRIS